MVPIWLQALVPRHTERLFMQLASRATELAGPLFVAIGYALILGISRVHFTKFVPRDSTTHLVASALLASELLLQYSLAIWSNPGYVELEHLADFISGEEDGDVAAQTAAVSFCKTCVRVKPPRAHHCRVCRRCVYEMDHHCPWINNCVGYYNYRHFWLLLMYIWICCLYVALLSARLFLATLNSSSNGDLVEETEASGPGRLDRFLIFFAFMATSTVGVVLCGYWGWHLYLVLTEQTTVDFMQRQGERKPFSVTAASARHTLGRMLGRQDWMWFVAFVLPPLRRRTPPKYMPKASTSGSLGSELV